MFICGIIEPDNHVCFMLEIGQKAPDFTLLDQVGEKHSLKDYLGKWVLFYAYPKDLTPGCTKEACGFRDVYKSLETANIQILGISADSVKRHEKFASTFSLPFPLLSDPEKEVLKLYGVIGLKKFMGREFEGISRYSFLIDQKGTIAKIYTSVKPAVHAAEVLVDVAQMSKA